MIKHVVMLKFHEEAEGKTKAENMQIFTDMLMDLIPIIPEIKSFETGMNEDPTDAAYDFVLVSEFETMESLKVYQYHPEHLKAAAFCEKVRINRIVVDYTFSPTK